MDYSRVNNLTSVLGYSPPLVAELVDKAAGFAFYSSWDLASAFWQLAIRPEDRARTAFDAGGRRYQWNRLPFGLANAPAAFARALETALATVSQELRGSKDAALLIFADDILCCTQELGGGEEQGSSGGGGGGGGVSGSSDGGTRHTMVWLCRRVLDCLREAGFTLSATKCDFCRTSAHFLGYTLSEEGVGVHEAKVAAVSRWAAPRDLASVRSLLGFAAFFSAHVPHLATMAAPLHLLKRKGQPWVWGPEQQEAFERIKEALTTAPVLRAPQFGVTAPRFALEVDASSVGWGWVLCVLTQEDSKGVARVVRYCVFVYFSDHSRDRTQGLPIATHHRYR